MTKVINKPQVSSILIVQLGINYLKLKSKVITLHENVCSQQ